MNNALRVALIASLAVVAVAGCTKKVKEAPPETPPADNGATTGGIVDNTPGRYTPADLDSDPCLRTRVIYFDFDQDLLRPEFQQTINCHAKYLRDRPEARMSLEGNADERGTREYNLGLGERRGNAVQSALSAAGGSSSQLNVVSYGEERPVCRQHDESCWSKNRRVEIIYTAK